MPILIRGSGGAKAKLQEKIITPTTAQQIILPDTGYDGFSKVTVNKVNLEYNKSVYDISGIKATTPSEGYIGMATARAYPYFDSTTLNMDEVSSDGRTLTFKPLSNYLSSYSINRIIFMYIYGENNGTTTNPYVTGIAIAKRGVGSDYRCGYVSHDAGATPNIDHYNHEIEVTCDTANNKFTVELNSSTVYKFYDIGYSGCAFYCT